MKSIKVLLAVAVLLGTTLVSASTSTVWWRHTLHPQETGTVIVDLPAGKSTVEVIKNGTTAAKLNCLFVHTSTGNVALVQKDMLYCFGRANLIIPTKLTVNITNLEDKDVNVVVFVRPEVR